MAAKSSLTTKDLVNMASLIERPLLQAGVKMNDIEKMTFGAANAAKAFGIGAEVAAMDIQQALSAGVHIKDRFAMSVLAQKGIDYTPEKFNKLTTEKKTEVFQRAFQSQAILDMAKKQGEDTFHGVMSTLDDNFSLLMGKIGQPVFKALTTEVAGWNTWMEKNSLTIDKIASTVSSSLVTGFRYVKSVAQFLYDHADTLMMIGKVWAVGKLGGMLGGGLGIGGGNLGAITGTLTPMGAMIKEAVRSSMMAMSGFMGRGASGALGTLGLGFSQMGGVLGALGPGGVLGIGYVAHQLGEYLGVHKALTQAIDPTRAKLIELEKSMEVFDDAVKRASKDLDNEKGALGSQSMKNAIGSVDYMKTQINVLRDVSYGRYKGAAEDRTYGLMGGHTGNIRAALASAGYTEDEMRQKGLFTRSGRLAEEMRLQARTQTTGAFSYLASHQTDIGIEAAMKMMTASERASIDTKKATQLVMEKFMQLFTSSGYGMTGLNAALMSPAEIKKMLLKESLDPFGGANINQNITNHINVEMTAKDPDRWLQELDDKVARKIKAPTQARGSIITRGGL
jgi:hypothetical protein